MVASCCSDVLHDWPCRRSKKIMVMSHAPCFFSLQSWLLGLQEKQCGSKGKQAAEELQIICPPTSCRPTRSYSPSNFKSTSPFDCMPFWGLLGISHLHYALASEAFFFSESAALGDTFKRDPAFGNPHYLKRANRGKSPELSATSNTFCLTLLPFINHFFQPLLPAPDLEGNQRSDVIRLGRRNDHVSCVNKLPASESRPVHQHKRGQAASSEWVELELSEGLEQHAFGAHPHVSKRTESNALSNKVCDLRFVYVHLGPSWSIWAGPLPGPTSQRTDWAVLTLVIRLVRPTDHVSCGNKLPTSKSRCQTNVLFLHSENQIAIRKFEKKNFENTFSPNRATLTNALSINTRGVERPHQNG